MRIRVALLALIACSVMWGQATAQMHGTVQDASGAAVPGAEVKATQTDTGISRAVRWLTAYDTHKTRG